MDAFTIEIAGLIARVQPLCVSTVEYCRSYLSDLEPNVYIVVSEEDLALQQVMAEQEAIQEGIRIRKYTKPHLERSAIQYKIALELLKRDFWLCRSKESVLFFLPLK